MIGSRFRRSFFATRRDSTFAASTLSDMAWQRARHAARRWGVAGALVGALLALPLFAPAAWMASAVQSASGGRVLLLAAEGTVWNGSALPALAGGEGSRDASLLPSRVHWRLRPAWDGLRLHLTQACCLTGELAMRIKPGLGRVALDIPPAPGGLGQWPAAWLAGLGTPFNTLQLGGSVRLATGGLTVESVQGRWRLTGGADVELLNVSSRLSTLDTLGSYRVALRGGQAGSDNATLTLDTIDGALRLSGSGQWAGSKFRLRAEARAADGQEGALTNLLNIIGRRQGALSVIAIG
jgi:general secretion pathway protein N